MTALLSRTKNALRKLDLRPSKKLGQNFLIQENYLDKIVALADLTDADIVIEIGPGLGFLTEKIAEHVHGLWTIEKDRRLFSFLEKNLKGIHHIRSDVLEIDLCSLIGRLHRTHPKSNIKILGNLPYRISSEILFKCLDLKTQPQQIIFLFQKEVVNRLMARPKHSSYGVLSLRVQSKFNIEGHFEIPADAFYPTPQVDSMVIKLTPKKMKLGLNHDEERLLWQIVRAGFSQRRKMFKNALTNSQSIPYTVTEIEYVLKENGLDLRVRAEEISFEQYIHITKTFSLK